MEEELLFGGPEVRAGVLGVLVAALRAFQVMRNQC